MIYYFVQMSGINSMSRKELANNIYIYIYIYIYSSFVRSFVHSFAVYLKMSVTQTTTVE